MRGDVKTRNVKTVRRYFNNGEAALARTLLQSAGISAVLSDENANFLVPGYSQGGMRLQVPDEDEARALQILDGKSEEFAPLPENFVPPPEVPGGQPPPDPRKRGISLEILATIFISLVIVVLAGYALVFALGRPEWTHSAKQMAAKGDEALKRKDYAEAVKDYDAALKAAPGNKTTLYCRGAAHFDNGDYKEAASDFTAAIHAGYAPAEARGFRANAYDQLEDYDAMLQDMNEVVRLQPGDVRGYLVRSVAYGRLRQFDDAAKDIEKAMALDPKNPVAYMYRGTLRSRLKDFDGARADLDEAVKLNPSDANYVNRALNFIRTKDYEKALDDCESALRANPKQGFAYALEGWICMRKKDYPGALKNTDRYVELTPRLNLAYTARAFVHSRMHDSAAAIEDCKRAIAVNPNSSLGYNSLAWIYATWPEDGVRDGAKAMELAKKACEISKWRVPQCIGTLAAAEAEMGRFDDAVKHETQAEAMFGGEYIDDETAQALHDSMECYKQGKPYRDTR